MEAVKAPDIISAWSRGVQSVKVLTISPLTIMLALSTHPFKIVGWPKRRMDGLDGFMDGTKTR
jgi:hypothetical protein